MLVAPLKLAFGVNVNPFKYALTLAAVPTIVIVLVPLPTTLINDVARLLEEITPLLFVTLNCTIILAFEASLIVIALPLVLDNTNGVSTLID